MATIPVFESILAQIHQSVGINPIAKLKKLARLESPLATHQQILKQLIDELFDVFGLNQEERADACLN